MNVYIKKTDFKDAIKLKKIIRESDKKEVIASHGSLWKAITACLKAKICLSVYKDDKLLCITGLEPDSFLSKKACIFLLSTKFVDKNKLTFYKVIKRMLKETLKDYECLYNFVDSRYNISIEWLKKMGAVFCGESYFSGVKFLYFEFRRN